MRRNSKFKIAIYEPSNRNDIVKHFASHGYDISLSRTKNDRAWIKFNNAECELAFKIKYPSVKEFAIDTEFYVQAVSHYMQYGTHGYYHD